MAVSPVAPALPDAQRSPAHPPTRSPDPPPPRPPRRPRSLGSLLPPLLFGGALVLLWQMLATAGGIAAYLLPAPGDVLRALRYALESGLLLGYARTTLVESLAGFALGSAVALPLGYATARSPLLASMLEPYLAASQAIPAVALAPLLMLWLGYGLLPVAALCALIVFFPTVVNTALGLRTLDRDVLDAARVDGAGGLALLWSVEVPLALPGILSGLRTSLTLAVTGAVVGEFVLGDQGLGGLLNIARANLDSPLLFATLLVLAALAAALFVGARAVERRLLALG